MKTPNSTVVLPSPNELVVSTNLVRTEIARCRWTVRQGPGPRCWIHDQSPVPTGHRPLTIGGHGPLPVSGKPCREATGRTGRGGLRAGLARPDHLNLLESHAVVVRRRGPRLLLAPARWRAPLISPSEGREVTGSPGSSGDPIGPCVPNGLQPDSEEVRDE